MYIHTHRKILFIITQEYEGVLRPCILALSEVFGGTTAPNWGPLAPIWGPEAPDHDGDGTTMSQTTYNPKFSFLHWIKRCKEPSCPRSPGLGIWRTLEVPDWGFGSWSWWGGVKNVPNILCFEIQLSTLNRKVQRTLMSWKSWSVVVEDSGGSWQGFWLLIMMGMGLKCAKLPMFWNSAFYIE